MKFAIFLQNYFPYGGLQLDAVRLAKAAVKAGDQPTLVVSTWSGERPGPDISVRELHCGGRSNHAKVARFAQACTRIMQSGEFPSSISFSRVPGAPFYFCGDACFLEKFQASKHPINRLLPRYRFFLNNEQRLFSPSANTHTFFLSQQEADSYQQHYPAPGRSQSILPPWLSPPVSFPESREQIRAQARELLQIPADSQLLLFVGSNYGLKRLHTIIEALPSLPENVHLAVCGKDDPSAPRQLARQLGVDQRVHLMGPQDHIPRWMLASDLLVHPSQRETAGMVLVEALSYGLPVTCTRLCGYAPHVADAGGTLLSQQCPPAELTTSITHMLASLPELQEKALNWAANPQHFQTADLILQSMRDSLPDQP